MAGSSRRECTTKHAVRGIAPRAWWPAWLHASLAPLLVCSLFACSVGNGEGELTGVITDPECDLEGAAVDVRPNFFVADDDREGVTIRVQRGGDYLVFSDGLSIGVADAAREVERLGTPIAVGPEGDVRMTFHYSHTCAFDRDRLATVLTAVEGTITLPGEAPQRISRLRYGSGGTGNAITPRRGVWSIDAENTGQAGRGFQLDHQGSTLVLSFYGYTTEGNSRCTAASLARLVRTAMLLPDSLAHSALVRRASSTESR